MAMSRISALVCLLAALGLPAWPQASTSNVRGTVRDQTGAAIPAVPVSLTNTATNVSLRSATNGIGFYMFAGVSPGTYRIEMEAPGMQKFEGNLTVQVAQDAVVDATLKVGQAATQISVQDVTPMVVVDNPALGQVVESTRIEHLPLNGRDIGGLLVTVPGLEGIRGYGSEENSHEFTIDGSSAADPYWGGNQRRKPGLDTVQEFKAETGGSSAKFNRPTTIVVSTKSGTNALHGAAFETNRNNGYGKARQRQDNYSKPPQLIRNEFGVNAGGPVYIPKLYNGKNRTFWFVAYEALRSISPSTRGGQVPTAAMRNGDFSQLMDSQGRLYRLYDPWTTAANTWLRQPFAHGGRANVIDPAKISPVAKYLFSVTPLPTEPTVNPLVDNNWWGPVPNSRRDWSVSARVDHTFSERDRVFGRFTKGDMWVFRPFGSGLPALDNVANTDTAIAPNKSLAFTYVRTVSPTLFNELLVSFTHEYWRDSTGGKVKYADRLGLPNPQGVDGWPGFYTLGLGNYVFDTQSNMESNLPTWMIDDHVTRIRGRHEIKFGLHVRFDNLTVLPDQQQPQGRHDAGTLATALYDAASSRTNPQSTPFTGSNLANLFLGVLNYGNRFVRPYYHMSGNEYAGYLQDNFKVSSRLTLNLGIRWEFWPAMRERDGLISGFDPRQRAIVLGADLDTFYRLKASTPSIVQQFQSQGAKFINYKDANLPPGLMDSNWNNFAPRLGFASRLTGGNRPFVVRGGYSTSYYRTALYTWAQTQRANTPTYATFWNSLNDSALTPDGIPNYGLRGVPTLIAGVNTKDAVSLSNASTLTRGSASINYFTQNQPSPRVNQWNFSVEREVMSDTVARVAYVGKHGANMAQWHRYNDTTPEYIWYATKGQRMPTGAYSNVATRNFDQTVYGSITEYRRSGFSNYNGVQMELQKRYSKGYGFQLFYIVGNALAAGGMGFDNPTSTVPELNQFLPGAVPADYDQRNRFLNYQRDTSIPKHRVRWNWVADLPFGKGKAIGRGAGRLLNGVIGGWQMAGMGNLRSTYFSLPTGIYPNGNSIELYGYQYPVEDCRSGACRPGYLWWNGYIPANQINSYDSKGKPNGVMGVPDSYRPAAQPLNPWPKNPRSSDPMYSYYGTNTVWVPLNDGSNQRTTYNSNLHPWRQQYFPSVRQWGLDASLFKVIAIRERVRVRFNADFFNVLNHPGNPNSVGSDGIESVRNSGSGARELQLSLRLTW